MTALPPVPPADANPFRYHFKFRYIVLYFFAISIALGMVFGSVVPAELLTVQSVYQIILVAAVMTLLCMLLMAKMVGLNMHVRDLMGSFPFNRHCLVLAMVLPVLIFSIGSGQVYFYCLVQLFPEQTMEMVGGAVELPTQASPLWEIAVSTLTVAVIVPLVEEFLFRGVLLHRWVTKMGLLPGLIVSSAVFGLLHPNPVGLTVFGLVTSLIYLNTGSLWLVAAFHALNNGTVLGLGLLFSSTAPADPEAFLQQAQSEWMVGCILIAISLPFLLYFAKLFWPRRSIKLPYFRNNSRRTYLKTS